MAENETTRNDDPERRPATVGGSPAVGDDGDVAFGGMVGIAVVSAILISMLALNGFFDAGTSSTAPVVAEETGESAAEDDGDEEEPAVEDEPEEETTTTVEAPPAVGSASALVDAGPDGIVLSGTVPSEEAAERLRNAAAANYSDDQIDDQLEVLDGADDYDVTVRGTLGDAGQLAAVQAAFDDAATEDNAAFVDELAVDAADPDGAVARVEATQAGIVLSGTVPSEEAAQRLRDAAATAYSDDQIDDQLEVLDGAASYDLTVTGATTDPVLFERLQNEFADIATNGGATVADELALEASSDLEAGLNALDQVLFQSGTADILPDSIPVLDAAAELLAGSPDARVQVGGHTDTRGGDVSNQALSEARAAAVVAELVDRGIESDRLEPRGFGETLPIIPDDDTAEEQQQNRRIEFRLL